MNKIKEIKNVLSTCCNAPVTRVGLIFFCMKCHKHCNIKDEEKKDES